MTKKDVLRPFEIYSLSHYKAFLKIKNVISGPIAAYSARVRGAKKLIMSYN